MNMSGILYKLDNVSKTYYLNKIPVNALSGISLDIHKNESLAFVGPSGSGKSTMLHILGTVDQPTEGKVCFKDTDMSALDDGQLSLIRARQIGFIFQNFNLIPILNVFENVEYPLRIRNIKLTREIKEKIISLIEDVDLKDKIRHKPGELSGGQRQRVAIARALIIDPAVILADEPTANLDSKTGDKILELIKSLTVKYGSTAIFATHDMKVINFVDKKIRIIDGVIDNIETN